MDYIEEGDDVSAPRVHKRLTVFDKDYKLNFFIFVTSLTLVLVLLTNLLLKSTSIPARFPAILLIGWVVGKILEVQELNPETGVIADLLPHASLHALMPPIFYIATLNVDYHTFSRSMGQILGVSLPAFVTHCFLVTGVSYPILYERLSWQWLPVFVMVTTLSSAQVDHTILKLKEVHGQLRQLHLLLQGEKVISVVAMSFIIPVLFKYYNPLNSETPEGFHVISYLGWLCFCTVPPIFAGLFYRYPLNFAYNEVHAQAALTLTTVSLCYWFAEFMGGGGPLSVLCFGIATGCSKLKFSSEAEKFFAFFWIALNFICGNMVYLIAGVLLGGQPQVANPSDLGFILVFYGLCLISRMIAMVTMGLIYIARSGWIAWKHYIVALWGVYKGSPNILLASYLHVVLSYPYGNDILAYVTCTTLLSLFVNVVSLNQLLRGIGMYDLSQSRILNMDAAVVLVNHCREKLAVNKFISNLFVLL